jgi:hypothetical protein
MKKLFWDTNIVLDLLGERNPFYLFPARIATLAEQNKCTLLCSGLTLATAYYILEKHENKAIAFDKISRFKQITSITIIDEQVITRALESDFSDFEDAIQHFSAVKAMADIIITRNAKDFKTSAIPFMTAKQYLALIDDPLL